MGEATLLRHAPDCTAPATISGESHSIRLRLPQGRGAPRGTRSLAASASKDCVRVGLVGPQAKLRRTRMRRGRGVGSAHRTKKRSAFRKCGLATRVFRQQQQHRGARLLQRTVRELSIRAPRNVMAAAGFLAEELHAPPLHIAAPRLDPGRLIKFSATRADQCASEGCCNLCASKARLRSKNRHLPIIQRTYWLPVAAHASRGPLVLRNSRKRPQSE
jgi:hypothetical protein